MCEGLQKLLKMTLYHQTIVSACGGCGRVAMRIQREGYTHESDEEIRTRNPTGGGGTDPGGLGSSLGPHSSSENSSSAVSFAIWMASACM